MDCLAKRHDDGYIRLSVAELSRLRPQHLLTQLDPDARPIHHPGCKAGLTEWFVSPPSCEKMITLGWDWYEIPNSSVIVIGDDDVRTNMMLVNDRGCDVGLTSTSQAIKLWLAGLDWTRAVLGALCEGNH